MSSYSASAATRRGSVVPPLVGVDKPVDSVPESCDVLISGTGLVESILAAALAWQGTSVLHIDERPYYGGVNAVLTVEQLQAWVDSVNSQGASSPFSRAQLYIPRPLSNRSYLVDLSPKLMFAKSDILALLIKSRVSQYLEFKQLGCFHTYENDSFEKVPGSKEDIFTDQTLSLLTKRSLMRFMKFVLEWEHQHDVWGSYAHRSVVDFLQEKFKLEVQQINELVYSIGLCMHPDTPTPRGLSRIKRYLVSLDVYGNFPALFSMYGSAGELAQGFCRSAAVAGATYKLNTAVVDFDTGSKVAVLSDGTRVNVAEKFVRLPRPSPQATAITRIVTIVAKDCREWFAENECAAVVVFPPGTLNANKFAVQAIIFGSGSGQCPEGQAVWYLSTIEQGNQARKDLEDALQKLEMSILRESTEDFEFDDVDVADVSYRPDGMPVLSSVKLGQSLQNFVPKEKLQYLLKLSFVQVVEGHEFLSRNTNTTEPTQEEQQQPIIDSHHILSEISYDGLVGQAKDLYAKIVGSDEDFFDVDFEDEEEVRMAEPKPDHEEFGDDMEL